MAGLALQTPSWRDPPTPPEPLWALCHHPHLLLGVTNPLGSRALSSPRGFSHISAPLSQERGHSVPPVPEGMLRDFRGDQISPGWTLVPALSLCCPWPWEAALLWGCGASTTNARQRDQRETHTLTLDQLRERKGQNHPPGLTSVPGCQLFSIAEVVFKCWCV